MRRSGQCCQPPAALRQTAYASSLKPAGPAVLCKSELEPSLTPDAEAPSDLAAKHDELLRPFALELRVLASLYCPQGGAVDIGRAWLWLPRAHKWRYTNVVSQHSTVPLGVASLMTTSKRCRSSARTLGALVCTSHCFVPTCPSAPTASPATRTPWRTELAGRFAGKQARVTESVDLCPTAVCRSAYAWQIGSVCKRWRSACRMAWGASIVAGSAMAVSHDCRGNGCECAKH